MKKFFLALICLVPSVILGQWTTYKIPTKYNLTGIDFVNKTTNKLLGVIHYKLFQNYPNPFNPTTTIKYQIPNAGYVTLKVYNILGQEVKTLVNENKAAGQYKVQFNGTGLASGIYFYRIKVGNFSEVKKLMLLK